MNTSGLIIGLLFIIAGIFFVILGAITTWWMLLYGIPLLIIGVIIGLNKNEDKIERRKDLKEKVYKQ